MQIHAAIVEDERSHAQALEECLRRYSRENGIKLDTSFFSDAVSFLFQYQPIYDVIFMDIRMPGTDGMTAAESLRKIDSTVPLVFVTSMVQYAVQGYDVGALDFIVKPVQYPAFRLKMRRILQAVSVRACTSVLLNVEGETLVVPSNKIYYIAVDNHELTYHTASGNYTLRGKLSAVAAQLARDQFFRVSASCLVNLHYVKGIREEDVLVAGDTVRLSRSKRKAFLEALARNLNGGPL